jgi:tetratricopeptide (TPR) repeat protein
MSLINQVLKDLEKRPRIKATSESILAGLRTSISLELRKNRVHYYVILLLVVILCCSSIFVITKSHKNPLQVATQKMLTVLPKKSLIVNNVISLPSYASNILLTGIAMQMQQDMTYLRFLLNQNTLYKLSSNGEGNELTIIFENTQLVASLPKINYAGSGIENIQAFKDEHGNLKLVLQLSNHATIRRLDLNETGGAPELQLDIFYKNIADVADNFISKKQSSLPVIIKNPVAESASEKLYQLALDQGSAGENTSAIRTLEKLLITYPEHNKARTYLANLLVQQGKKFEATKVLDVGMKLTPENTVFITMKAKLLVEQAKVSDALALLQKHTPSIVAEPEYYAFIAALYQRQGQTRLAGNLYKRLLGFQPSNAKWWVGLGIALEASGDNAQAFEAYTNADNIGNLNPELKNFLTGRLHTT